MFQISYHAQSSCCSWDSWYKVWNVKQDTQITFRSQSTVTLLEQSSSFLVLYTFFLCTVSFVLYHLFERPVQPINMIFLLKQGSYLLCHHHWSLQQPPNNLMQQTKLVNHFKNLIKPFTSLYILHRSLSTVLSLHFKMQWNKYCL